MDGSQTTFEHESSGMSAPKFGQSTMNSTKSSSNNLRNAQSCHHLKIQLTTAGLAVVLQMFPKRREISETAAKS